MSVSDDTPPDPPDRDHTDRRRPIHVLVASALGWTEMHGHTQADHDKAEFRGGACGWPPGIWTGLPPVGSKPSSLDALQTWIPDYSADWRAGGQLIERYRIHLRAAASAAGMWAARKDSADGEYGQEHYARTPLLAVCALVIALAETGRLE